MGGQVAVTWRTGRRARGGTTLYCLALCVFFVAAQPRPRRSTDRPMTDSPDEIYRSIDRKFRIQPFHLFRALSILRDKVQLDESFILARTHVRASRFLQRKVGQ